MKKAWTNFPVVSFDWIHRSGKWTQIQLLKDYCGRSNIKNYVFRWEYYRFWSWINEIEDPYSEWRQENKYADCYREKSQKLNRELRITMERVLPNKHSINQEDVLILLDRSILWRYMQNNTTLEPEKDFNNFLTFKLWDKSAISREVLIPDLMVVFKPSQEELKKRLFSSKELFASHEELLKSYKYDMIYNLYKEFYWWLENVPNQLKKNIVIINGDLNTEEIHEKVLCELKQRWLI